MASDNFSYPGHPADDTYSKNELLQDLRNIIVTDDSESLKELLSVIGGLQAKLQDREGLAELIKPVITAVIREKMEEDPDGWRSMLKPLVREILEEEKQPAGPGKKNRLETTLQSLKKSTGGLLHTFRPRKRKTKTTIKEEPQGGETNEIIDADFALVELFLLAHPSLVLLAHGSWQPPELQNPKQLLPLIRTFITSKLKDRARGEPLKASYHECAIHIEPSKHAYLALFYTGSPPIGFFLDVRQVLSDMEKQHAVALKRAQTIPAYRPIVRLLLDRYCPRVIHMGNKKSDPITWPQADA